MLVIVVMAMLVVVPFCQALGTQVFSTEKPPLQHLGDLWKFEHHVVADIKEFFF